MAAERRKSEGLGYKLEPKSNEDHCFQMKDQEPAIPRDLTNFTSARVLGSTDDQVTVPTEDWVCIEDYYSDEEQSGAVEAVPTGSKALVTMEAPWSVCLALPPTDTADNSAGSVAELTISYISAATSALQAQAATAA